jgi:endonuclease/exonuclease/phosphatase family metal-dependent hydrolase
MSFPSPVRPPGGVAALLLVLASSLLVSRSAASPDPVPPPSVEHRLLTWNVGTIDPRDVRLPTRFEDDVIAVIASQRAAVVVLQELQGEAQAGRLQEALRARGLAYEVALESSDPRREDGRPMAVLHLAKALGAVTLRTTVAGGFRARAVMLEGITVVAVHAPTGLGHRKEFFPQLAAWAATLPKPVVLAGDFNLGPRRGAGSTFFLPWTWKQDRRLYADLTRNFPVRTNAPSTTFYGQVYDHVMSDSGSIVSARVLLGHRTFPQDHEPLLVTLSLPAPAPVAPEQLQVEAPEQRQAALGLVDALPR